MSASRIDLSTGPGALGVLAFRGTDAARFLQGQVSADIEKLDAGASTLAGLANPQGRVIALLAIVRTSPDELLAVVPQELAANVSQRLRKFVFRSKVIIEDLSASCQVLGSATQGSSASIAWGTRRLLLVPASEAPAPDAAALASWQRADITEGLPQVYAATSEAFVAQMLNLDLLGAISFAKGCYTGQEVIARAHYRGRVKRRVQRWQGSGNYVPRAGDSVRSNDGRALSVVRSAPAATHGWEILAVGPFAAGASDSASPDNEATTIQVVGPLPLPYSLPE